MSAPDIRRIFESLLDACGPQGWWPGGTELDILAGAVLVQNTRWRNAELAINRLQEAGIKDVAALARLEAPALAELIRPAGTYRVKAARLRALARWFVRQDRMRLDSLDTHALRRELLRIEGVGPETADVLLVYLFDRAAFIADAYARRIFRRIDPEFPAAYEAARVATETGFAGSAQEFNELHALLVEHAKRHCRKQPFCAACALAGRCNHAQSAVQALD